MLKESMKICVFTGVSCVTIALICIFARSSQHKLFWRITSAGNDAFDKYIYKNYDVNYREGHSLLVFAILNNNGYQVDALLSKNADVNVAEPFSATPLMFAAEFADSSIVQLLLNCGATVTNRDEEGNNALNYAATGNPENSQLLAAAGVDINNSNKYGFTPLLKAVECHEQFKRNYVEILTLLYLGANVHCTNKAGETPLSVALQGNDTNLVELLQVNWRELKSKNQP